MVSLVHETSAETFAQAFAEALDRRGASLTWLRDRLAARGYRISLATLSYWRSGHRVPTRDESLDALAEIEALLDVRDGALDALARAGRRDRSTPTPFDRLALGVRDGEVRGEHDVDRVLMHLSVDVDRAGRSFESTVTQLFVAARDGVEGVSMFIGPDPDGESNSTRVEALTGCRIGPVDDRADGIRTVRLEFERPCQTGESVLVQTRVVDHGPHVEAETEYGVVAEQRLEDCLVLVRFQPDEVPTRCWVAYQEGTVEDEWEVDLAGRTSVHLRQTAFGPGTCRVRWEW
jgi:hypothetical protein